MIITETITINGRELSRSYSDAGYKIENAAGDRYDEAIDPMGSGRVYTETDIPVEDAEATEEDYKAALMRLGVREEDE